MRIACLLPAVLALASCGLPPPGESCPTEGALGCTSSTASLFCERGVVREFPCKGTGGCVSDGSKLVCSIRAVAGDACQESQLGKGQCDVSNPNLLLTCASTGWVARACHSCSTAPGGISCQPFAGDPCTSADEGTGICDPANANQLIKCVSGLWTTVACRSACMKTASGVSCP